MLVAALPLVTAIHLNPMCNMHSYLAWSLATFILFYRQEQLTNNTRKTPKKAFRVKSWGDSPYRKKKKTTTPMKAKQADLSWFENDAVFGFFE